MKAILGEKLGMGQIFTPEGKATPSTLIKAGPCPIVQVKTREKDGYPAVQIGYGAVKKVSKPLAGHFNKAKVKPVRFLREFRQERTKDSAVEYRPGNEVKVDIFKGGEYVEVTGISKGKGFQGGVKRWGFKGGPGSHGSMQHRAPGSIGASSFPSKVVKGHHMAGHMGAERVTVQNLKVVKVIPEKDLLVVKGAVPGPRGGLLLIRQSPREIREPKAPPPPAKLTRKVKKR